MAQGRRGGLRPALGLVVAALLAGASARADEVEQRWFSIQVDGKSAGDAHMTLTRRDDGAEVVVSRVHVRVRFLLLYTYSYEGTEVWAAGRLQGLQSACDDNGKRFQVSATATGEQLQVSVNGQGRLTRPDLWTTSFWKLPEARLYNQDVVLLDADRGQELARHLQRAGPEELELAGQAQKCDHFRVTGGPSPTDLWFDGQHRLVREDFVELGHRTVVQLTSVRR